MPDREGPERRRHRVTFYPPPRPERREDREARERFERDRRTLFEPERLFGEERRDESVGAFARAAGLVPFDEEPGEEEDEDEPEEDDDAAYTPQFPVLFWAIFSGALSAMQANGWIGREWPGVYWRTTEIAGAYARACDLVWADFEEDATDPPALTAQAIELAKNLAQSLFAKRVTPSPTRNRTFHRARNWRRSARALVGVLRAALRFENTRVATPSGSPSGGTVVNDIENARNDTQVTLDVAGNTVPVLSVELGTSATTRTASAWGSATFENTGTTAATVVLRFRLDGTPESFPSGAITIPAGLQGTATVMNNWTLDPGVDHTLELDVTGLIVEAGAVLIPVEWAVVQGFILG